jgi:hypothetical protein
MRELLLDITANAEEKPARAGTHIRTHRADAISAGASEITPVNERDVSCVHVYMHIAREEARRRRRP